MNSTDFRTVAVLVETDDTWGRNVVESVARHARAARWRLLIGPRDSQRRLRLPDGWAGDGVIVSLRDESIADHIRSTNKPAVDVSIAMPEHRWLGRVVTDDSRRAKMAFEHLRSQGFKRFGVYAPPIGRYHSSRAGMFAQVVEAAGFSCDNSHSADLDWESGWLADYTRAAEWLDGLEKPVGIFASDPYPARQLAEVCDGMGVTIPDEVAIIAGDTDDLLCSVAWPPITSVELASHRIGSEACQMLSELMEGAKVAPEPKLIPPLRVLPRHSTDVMAMDDDEFVDILRMIREQAADGLEVKDLLKSFAISRRGLELKFRDFLGRTPADEIRRVRLEHVRRLLLETDMTIATIASHCGFASGSTISHAFRKYFNITPGELRACRVSPEQDGADGAKPC